MFRSLHMKLVLIMVLIMISVMAVVGTFMLNSVTVYNIDDFLSQMGMVFTSEFILTLEQTEKEAVDPPQALKQVMEAYAVSLGVDEYRVFYILDAKTGKYLAGSNDSLGEGLLLTPNMLAAMNGEVGQTVERLNSYFDIAIPINVSVGSGYIVGVMDNKQELSDLNWNLFAILVRAMLFGMFVAILLSFFLSKTITKPVEKLTAQASQIAAGSFDSAAEVYSNDELGVLTQTFNNMATVLKDTLDEVEGERNKLDTLFRHMADGVIAFDSDGRIIHINPEAVRMLGKEYDESSTYSQVFPGLDVEEQNLEEDGQYIEIDYLVNKRTLKMFFVPFRMPEGSGMMAVMHDITQQRRLDDTRKEFVANVSHELRTPLTSVKGYAETLIEAGEDIDKETQGRFLGIINSEAERMMRIVKDLLTLTQLDYNRMEMNFRPVDIRGLAVSATDAIAIEAGKQNITLHCDLPAELPKVNGDRDRLEQVIVNILSNAIKYNTPGGSVTLSAKAEKGSVTLQIKDTGIGIPKEDIPRVFERFYRVDKARSRERGGTGLGLAIAKEIVEFHGGTIAFDSEVGEGTTVTISFPAMNAGEKNG